jgi:hypothetical protein
VSVGLLDARFNQIISGYSFTVSPSLNALDYTSNATARVKRWQVRLLFAAGLRNPLFNRSDTCSFRAYRRTGPIITDSPVLTIFLS